MSQPAGIAEACTFGRATAPKVSTGYHGGRCQQWLTALGLVAVLAITTGCSHHRWTVTAGRPTSRAAASGVDDCLREDGIRATETSPCHRRASSPASEIVRRRRRLRRVSEGTRTCPSRSLDAGLTVALSSTRGQRFGPLSGETGQELESPWPGGVR